MKGGSLIFPNNDIPDISQGISEINNCKVFSETVFQYAFQDHNPIGYSIDDVRNLLSQHGFKVVGRTKFIEKEKIAQINSQYGVDDAMKKISMHPITSPLIHLPSNTRVTELSDGTWIL
jgi:hypothetical protein